MAVVIDLNDVALGLWQNTTPTFSPGYAQFAGSRYQYGAPARATSRRTPREVNTRYWSQLNTESLTPALGPARHSADLAHGHLQTLLNDAGQPENALLLVPGHWSREQLSLLLGLTDALNLAVDALLHRSAAVGAVAGYDQGAHVELQLHQTLVTPWHQVDGKASTLPAQQLPGMGLLALQDKLATAIARLFVQQSRFDPLRSAEAEQALYDNMAEALTELQSQNETQLNINGYQARITREDIEPIGIEFRKRIEGLQGPGALAIEYPLSLLPGLDHDGSVIALERSAMVALVQSQWETLKQPREQLALIRAVASQSISADAAAPRATAVSTESHPVSISKISVHSHNGERLQRISAPTHLLIGHHARPIGQLGATLFGAWAVSQQSGQWWLEQAPVEARINEHRVAARKLLQIGDTLVDGHGTQALLICIED